MLPEILGNVTQSFGLNSQDSSSMFGIITGRQHHKGLRAGN